MGLGGCTEIASGPHTSRPQLQHVCTSEAIHMLCFHCTKKLVLTKGFTIEQRISTHALCGISYHLLADFVRDRENCLYCVVLLPKNQETELTWIKKIHYTAHSKPDYVNTHTKYLWSGFRRWVLLEILHIMEICFP